MTEPLTPPDCNCQGLPFMPLEVNRLLDSDMVALSTGDEFKAALILWAKSWSQVPAASLPDDERILARWTGYSLTEWRLLREMALKNWITCSDGRLYHPVIADLAMATQAKRKGQSERANSRWAKARAAKNAAALPPVAVEDADAYATASEIHAGVMQAKGTVEGIEDPPTPLVGGPSEKLDAALKAYPLDGTANCPPRKSQTAWWRAVAVAGSEERLLAAVLAFIASGFTGKPRRFDRWLDDGSFEAFLGAELAQVGWTGPPDVLRAIVAVKGEAWVASWISRCAWRDLPERTLIAPSKFHLERILADLGSTLTVLSIAVALGPERTAA